MTAAMTLGRARDLIAAAKAAYSDNPDARAQLPSARPGSRSRCASRWPARSRPGSRRCSTPSWGRTSPPPTRPSAPGRHVVPQRYHPDGHRRYDGDASANVAVRRHEDV